MSLADAHAAATPRPANALGIRLGEHWAIVGATGSGKTRFACGLLEYLRRHYPSVKRYVLDSTEDGMPDIKFRLEVRGNRIPDPLRNAAYTQIWIPDTDVAELYNAWLEKHLYRREPAIILIDELASLGKAIDQYDGFIKLMKQGRKHGITLINLTQEIANVSPTVFRQMSHFANFRINAETYDLAMSRKYLALSKEEQRQPTNPYGFFYRRTTGPFPAREYASMQAFFRNTI